MQKLESFREKHFGKMVLVFVFSLAALLFIGGFFGSEEAQAYEFTCTDPPSPFSTIGRVTGVTFEGRRVFIGRAIVGNGKGGEIGEVSEVPQCNSEDPMFVQEGNLFVTLDDTQEPVYILTAVLVYLDPPLDQTPQP